MISHLLVGGFLPLGHLDAHDLFFRPRQRGQRGGVLVVPRSEYVPRRWLARELPRFGLRTPA